MTKFEKQLETFLLSYFGMKQDNFLEALPEIQEGIESLMVEFQKMKDQAGNVIITVESGAAEVSEKPAGFITGIEIWDYDVPEDYGNEVEGLDTEENEDGDRYQKFVYPIGQED
jgi:hypothetical protein